MMTFEDFKQYYMDKGFTAERLDEFINWINSKGYYPVTSRALDVWESLFMESIKS